MIEDIVNSEGFNFTDGSGFISKRLSKEINEKYGLMQCSTY